MKRGIFLFAVSCLLLLTGFRPPSDPWIVYASESAHFAITFPDNPTGQYLVENEIHLLTYSPPYSGIYMLAWRDMQSYYPANATIKELLKDGMDGVTGSIGVKDVTVTHIEEKGNPYIEFIFKTKEYLGKSRIYIIHEFQYTLIATGSLRQGVTPEMDRFVSSFRYLP